ncbi:M23 family metallopeptidase [Siminovitchia sp. FSL W7-1587]|uniref:M23 family metallopeptidase n=1 Tax=Siminovitchia sp. FSL W7-1587 TaxID=2954699 RepID=UPI0030CF8431
MSFIWPLRGDFVVTSGFRTPSRRNHHGIDLDVKGSGYQYNVPVIASAAGTVSRSYFSTGGYGECVMIVHNINGQTWETVYAHMHKGSRTVKVGDRVSQGQRIGYMGATGQVDGQHLHFELHRPSWNGNKSNAVNPLNYLSDSGGGDPGGETGVPQPEYAHLTKNGRIGIGTIVVPVLNVRNQPSTNGRIIRTKKRGEGFYVYKISGDWRCIGTNKGEQEWISNANKEYANIRWFDLKGGRIGEFTVTVKEVYSRYTTDQNGEISRLLKQGHKGFIYKEYGNWICIGNNKGREEWLHNNYVNNFWY